MAACQGLQQIMGCQQAGHSSLSPVLIYNLFYDTVLIYCIVIWTFCFLLSWWSLALIKKKSTHSYNGWIFSAIIYNCILWKTRQGQHLAVDLAIGNQIGLCGLSLWLKFIYISYVYLKIQIFCLFSLSKSSMKCWKSEVCFFKGCFGCNRGRRLCDTTLNL